MVFPEPQDYILFGSKLCTSGHEAPACTDFFTPDASAKDGLKGTCKSCVRERQRTRYAEDPAFRAAAHAKYRRQRARSQT